MELVAGSEGGRILVVVDGRSVVREEPGEDQKLVRERLRSPHGGDALALAVGLEVKRDPLDHRLVGVVAHEEPEVVLVRTQELPAPEPAVAEDLLDPLRVSLEGLGHSLVPLAETDAGRAERQAALRPLRGGLAELVVDLVAEAPVLLLVGPEEELELVLERLLEDILVGHATLVVDEGRHEGCVAGLPEPGRVLLGNARIGQGADRRVELGERDVDQA